MKMALWSFEKAVCKSLRDGHFFYAFFNYQRTTQVLRILKENVVHYFNVALENQIIFDEEGVISNATEFRRSLRCGGKPKVTVADINNLTKKQTEQWNQFLQDMQNCIQTIPQLKPRSIFIFIIELNLIVKYIILYYIL